MRALKLTTLTLFLIAASILYILLAPAHWYSNERRKAISILSAAQTPKDLTNAVGYLGIVLHLTNNAWIAIRYRDVHGPKIDSIAIARDSGGAWFESDRHFCGTLAYWPKLKDSVEAFPDRADADNGMFPSYREMNAIDSAPDLPSARRALVAIGFKEFKN
jgi:hypothetical protein